MVQTDPNLTPEERAQDMESSPVSRDLDQSRELTGLWSAHLHIVYLLMEGELCDGKNVKTRV